MPSLSLPFRSKKTLRPTISTGLLPTELLVLIFSHLDPLDLLCTRLVCRLWSQVVPLTPHFSNSNPTSLCRPYTVVGKHFPDPVTDTSNCAPVLGLYVSAKRLTPPGVWDSFSYDIKILGLSDAHLGSWNGGARLNPVLGSARINTDFERLASQTHVTKTMTERYPKLAEPRNSGKLVEKAKAQAKQQRRFSLPNLLSLRSPSKPQPPWHAMYISLPPVRWLKLTLVFGEPSEPDEYDAHANCANPDCQFKDAVVGWNIGSEIVRREEGVLVTDVARAVKRVLENVEFAAHWRDLYDRDR